MLRFLAEETDRDEDGKIRVDMAGGLEALVEFALHLFPDGVAVGADDHAAAHGAVVGELGFADDVEVPASVVFGARGDFAVVFGAAAFGLLFLLLGLVGHAGSPRVWPGMNIGMGG